MIHLIRVKCAASEYFFLFILRGLPALFIPSQRMSRKVRPTSDVLPTKIQRQGSSSMCLAYNKAADGRMLTPIIRRRRLLDYSRQQHHHCIQLYFFSHETVLTVQMHSAGCYQLFNLLLVSSDLTSDKGASDQIADHQIISRYCSTGH